MSPTKPRAKQSRALGIASSSFCESAASLAFTRQRVIRGLYRQNAVVYAPPQEPKQREPWAQQLYDDCRYDLRAFAEHFFAHLCRDPFSQMHLDFFQRDYDDLVAQARGLRDATAAPRGGAKTTYRGFIRLAHDCVYRDERFILVLSATADQAEDRVKQLRDELEHNELLVKVYGKQVGDTWNNANFITAPDIYNGAPGVRVKAASPTTQLRGLLEKGSRVTKIFGDDFESSERVETELQREKTERRFFEDILKLGEPGTNVEMIGTLLHPDSLLSKLLRNTGFRRKKYQAVLQFADASAIPLWQQWRDIFLDLDNPNNITDARAFFEAHETAMLAGHEVLWPEREPYYNLMVMRLVEGETAFQIEKQNNPSRAEGKLFDMSRAGYFSIEPEALLRRDGRRVSFLDIVDLVAYWDPAIGQDGNPDWSACVVLGKDRQGYAYVLDALMMQAILPHEQDTRIADLLLHWQVRRFGCEANTFQTLALNNVKAAVVRKAQEIGQHYAPIYLPIQSTRNKMIRISTLDGPIAHKHIWFAENLHREFMRQMDVFRPIDGADKDDGPDALSGAMLVLHNREK